MLVHYTVHLYAYKCNKKNNPTVICFNTIHDTNNEHKKTLTETVVDRKEPIKINNVLWNDSVAHLSVGPDD